MKTEIRKTIESDVKPIMDFIKKTGFFRDDEVVIAEEVLNDAVSGKDLSYQSYTCLLESKVLGWICFGETPCTVGTYDIYWIAVSPDVQKGGIGTQMLRFAEQAIASAKGRLAVIETSGAEMYVPTQQFYYKNGYELAACVENFYNVADDKLIFIKTL